MFAKAKVTKMWTLCDSIQSKQPTNSRVCKPNKGYGKLGAENKSSKLLKMSADEIFEKWPFPFMWNINGPCKDGLWSTWTYPVKRLKTSYIFGTLIELLGCPNEGWARNAYYGLLDLIQHGSETQLVQGLTYGGMHGFRKLFSNSPHISATWDGFAAGLDIFERLLTCTNQTRQICIENWGRFIRPISRIYKIREQHPISIKHTDTLTNSKVVKDMVKSTCQTQQPRVMSAYCSKKECLRLAPYLINQILGGAPQFSYEPKLENWLLRIEALIALSCGLESQEYCYTLREIKRLLPTYESLQGDNKCAQTIRYKHETEQLSSAKSTNVVKKIAQKLHVTPSINRTVFKTSRIQSMGVHANHGPLPYKSGPAPCAPGSLMWHGKLAEITEPESIRPMSQQNTVKRSSSPVIQMYQADNEMSLPKMEHSVNASSSSSSQNTVKHPSPPSTPIYPIKPGVMMPKTKRSITSSSSQSPQNNMNIPVHPGIPIYLGNMEDSMAQNERSTTDLSSQTQQIKLSDKEFLTRQSLLERKANSIVLKILSGVHTQMTMDMPSLVNQQLDNVYSTIMRNISSMDEVPVEECTDTQHEQSTDTSHEDQHTVFSLSKRIDTQQHHYQQQQQQHKRNLEKENESVQHESFKRKSTESNKRKHSGMKHSNYSEDMAMIEDLESGQTELNDILEEYGSDHDSRCRTLPESVPDRYERSLNKKTEISDKRDTDSTELHYEFQVNESIAVLGPSEEELENNSQEKKKEYEKTMNDQEDKKKLNEEEIKKENKAEEDKIKHSRQKIILPSVASLTSASKAEVQNLIPVSKQPSDNDGHQWKPIKIARVAQAKSDENKDEEMMNTGPKLNNLSIFPLKIVDLNESFIQENQKEATTKEETEEDENENKNKENKLNIALPSVVSPNITEEQTQLPESKQLDDDDVDDAVHQLSPIKITRVATAKSDENKDKEVKTAGPQLAKRSSSPEQLVELNKMFAQDVSTKATLDEAYLTVVSATDSSEQVSGWSTLVQMGSDEITSLSTNEFEKYVFLIHTSKNEGEQNDHSGQNEQHNFKTEFPHPVANVIEQSDIPASPIGKIWISASTSQSKKPILGQNQIEHTNDQYNQELFDPKQKFTLGLSRDGVFLTGKTGISENEIQKQVLSPAHELCHSNGVALKTSMQEKRYCSPDTAVTNPTSPSSTCAPSPNSSTVPATVTNVTLEPQQPSSVDASVGPGSNALQFIRLYLNVQARASWEDGFRPCPLVVDTQVTTSPPSVDNDLRGE